MRVSDPLTIPVSAVTTLIDRQAIWDLTVEYAHAADLHDGEAVAAMFADDGVLSVRTGDGAVVDLVGRDDIASRLGRARPLPLHESCQLQPRRDRRRRPGSGPEPVHGPPLR